MTFAIAYWVLMLLALCLGTWSAWPNYKATGFNVLLFLLLAIIGWQVFGAPLHR
jgi:hypothetical protein